MTEPPEAPSPVPIPLSKSAQKKALKAERRATHKLERRAREKQAKKDKKRVLAEKRDAGELDEDEREVEEKRRKRRKVSFGARVVVDLGFDELMNEKEVTSLCSQLAYTYSANRRAGFPFVLVYTSLDGKTLTKLDGMTDAGYKRWERTEWLHEGYETLWQAETGIDHKCTRENTVYLTADSKEELIELSKDETYIIGGICDHNRYKNLCLDKATASNIRTARLPIGRYLSSLPTRKVLTVNQVFEILLHWVESRDWEKAFYEVIPKRKFAVNGKDKQEEAQEVQEVDEVREVDEVQEIEEADGGEEAAAGG